MHSLRLQYEALITAVTNAVKTKETIKGIEIPQLLLLPPP